MLKCFLGLFAILAIHRQITTVKSITNIPTNSHEDILSDIRKKREVPPSNLDHEFNYQELLDPTPPEEEPLIEPITEYHNRHKHKKRTWGYNGLRQATTPISNTTIANLTTKITPTTKPVNKSTNAKPIRAKSAYIKALKTKSGTTKRTKFRSATSKSTTALTTNVRSTAKLLEPEKSKRLIEKIDRVSTANAFRRQNMFDEEGRNKPQKWTHCFDLITPHLVGLKSDLQTKQVSHKDGIIRRLTHLLSVNTTDYSKEDIVSILYQISNLRIRIFQWDYIALTTVLNTVIRNPHHSFRTFKAGVKDIFKKWHLDTSNLSSFLEQTRIFRPPCIKVSEFEGSTKTSPVERFTTTSSTYCPEYK